MALLTTKTAKPPFRGPDESSFYCKHCDSYTANFWKSFIEHGTRICRSCYNSRRKAEPTEPISRLRRRLYKALHGAGHRDLAKGLSDDSIRCILASHGVEDPSSVKSIRPPKGKHDLMIPNRYKVVYCTD